MCGRDIISLFFSLPPNTSLVNILAYNSRVSRTYSVCNVGFADYFDFNAEEKSKFD